MIEDVTFAYGERLVLNGVNASLRQGELNAVVGPSGSGKSTLLALIAGLRRPARGRVRIMDDRGEPVPPGSCSWVPQGANVLGDRSVLDNAMIGSLALGSGLSAARERGMAALGDVGLGSFAEFRAKVLSGGELQRLTIARALAAGHRLILIDEPTASLDAETTRGIADLLAVMADRALLVVATHDPIVADRATEKVVLR